MARANYIYILRGKKKRRVFGAWTVKREMLQSFQRGHDTDGFTWDIFLSEFEVVRLRDNGGPATFVDWLKKMEQMTVLTWEELLGKKYNDLVHR